MTEIDLRDLLFHSLRMDPAECTGKVIVITGAGRGIGLQAARAFALLGGRVVIAERSEQGRQAAKDINQAGGRALFIQTDVSDAASVRRLAEQTRRAFGPVDILINNAIRIAVAPVAEMDDALWDEIIAVNLRGTFSCCKTFLPEMLARKSGLTINMISAEAMPGLSAYIASKQGMLGFSQSLAIEVGSSGIQVVPFAPGMVETPGMVSVADDLAPRLGMTREQFFKFSLHSAYDGFMPPEHAGAATAYLALRLAAEYHGQLVNGYEVLERAGLIHAAEAETLVTETPPTAATQIHPTERASRENLARLVQAARDILAESTAQFEKMPPFFRPLAKNGFKNKSGAGLEDWQRRLSALQQQVEEGSLPGEAAHALIPRLEKLLVYYQEEPKEFAGFTRDQEAIREVIEISKRRVGHIRELVECLKTIE